MSRYYGPNQCRTCKGKGFVYSHDSEGEVTIDDDCWSCDGIGMNSYARWRWYNLGRVCMKWVWW